MISKEKAGYVNKVKTRLYKKCGYFHSPNGCGKVKGIISPNGSCNYWRAK